MSITPLRMGEIIREKRRLRNLTQSDLANAANVSVQAVSKWEIGQSFPDMALLPLLAEVLEVPISTLFDWKEAAELPFPDDGKLRVVQYQGTRLVRADESGSGAPIPLATPEGTVSQLNVWVSGCAQITGNFSGSMHVEGDMVCGGSIQAEGDAGLHIGGELVAGSNVSANGGVRIMGNLNCGGSVMVMHGLTCGGDIEGDVKATGDIHVGGDIDGDVSSQNGSVYCQGDIDGSVRL